MSMASYHSERSRQQRRSFMRGREESRRESVKVTHRDPSVRAGLAFSLGMTAITAQVKTSRSQATRLAG
jgi:hypothetical protein